MSRNRTNIGASMLQPGRRTSGSVESTMVVEMPMVLTIEQLAPNPDNPRTSRNPRYDEIKASIKARGLDTVPKSPAIRMVTRINTFSVMAVTPVIRY